jgi:hypothetical protein
VERVPNDVERRDAESTTSAALAFDAADEAGR